MSIETVAQSRSPGAFVHMFRLDTTSVGGTVVFFAQARREDGGVYFGGQYYVPFDIEFSGFETNGTGSLPTPRMRLSNTNLAIQSMLNTYGDDLIGCPIQRVRTFARFLDGQPEADPTAYFGPDSFRFERKTAENPIFVEWELSASIDQEGKLLPGRQVIRDTCMWRYRRWDHNSNSFDYSKVTDCTYTGGNCFNRKGEPVSADQDECGRRLSDCAIRFGPGATLPFGGFPGVARTR